jgi:hypothetical protein
MDERALDPYQIDRVSQLPGTVKYYNRHIIMCSGHSEWPAKIQDEGGFIKALSSKLNKRTELNAIKLTACDLPSMETGETILIFPDQVRISGLTEDNLENLMNYLTDGIQRGLQIESFQKFLILVCGHHNRDVRCGLAAPGIMQKMKELLEQLGLSEQVMISRSSHLGGHKFAGVAVVYPSGNWYGRLTEQDAAHVIKAECVEHQPYPALWRGRMGLNEENQINSAKAAGWIVLVDKDGNEAAHL